MPLVEEVQMSVVIVPRGRVFSERDVSDQMLEVLVGTPRTGGGRRAAESVA